MRYVKFKKYIDHSHEFCVSSHRGAVIITCRLTKKGYPYMSNILLPCDNNARLQQSLQYILFQIHITVQHQIRYSTAMAKLLLLL